MTDQKTSRTLDRFQNPGQMVKPAELIEIRGAAKLTLVDRRIYNLLIHNAFAELGEAGREFEIAVDVLKEGHEGNDQLIAAVESLMKTIAVILRADGSTTRAQLLGPNNISDPRRPRGTFRYTIPTELAAALRDSETFAILELEVLRNFTSKYAMALYELAAKRARLRYKATESFTLEEIREYLGVPEGKLKGYSNLNQFAIKPALLETNALAEFEVTLQPIYAGKRRVVGMMMGWCMKSLEGRKAAYGELQRPKVGRMARLTGKAEYPE